MLKIYRVVYSSWHHEAGHGDLPAHAAKSMKNPAAASSWPRFLSSNSTVFAETACIVAWKQLQGTRRAGANAGRCAKQSYDVDSGFVQSPRPQPDTQNDHESAVEDHARNKSLQGHEMGLVSLSPNGGPHYIGPYSGYFVARRILPDASHQRRRNTIEPNTFASMNLSPLMNIPALLPPQKDSVLELSTRYFKTVHLIYPFLYGPSHMKRIVVCMHRKDNSPWTCFMFLWSWRFLRSIFLVNLKSTFLWKVPIQRQWSMLTMYAEKTRSMVSKVYFCS